MRRPTMKTHESHWLMDPKSHPSIKNFVTAALDKLGDKQIEPQNDFAIDLEEWMLQSEGSLEKKAHKILETLQT